ncbi:uncharacterized protein LTR77_003482 [Saxophila tyrrhenica]|uniref:Nascent polypeptide-associated complex subunit alpha-like UBA domain-containing protein n=1 Tax=Saxophila tyrrhenica TaxID=1690608 RepID=A0AAV9PDY2_9PEZI|nr:hypothetical protein LTR77_003482 [Saxophila tyrrhenica]
MAEPQPPDVVEGADPPESIPATADDRAAAKAMDSLDARGEDVEAPTTAKKEVDVKALTDAMKLLETSSGAGASTQKKAQEQKKKEEEVKKPLIKVDQGDVALLVEQLDVNKVKATEILRAHEADAVAAMKAWVTAAV